MGKQCKQCQTLFLGAPESLQIVIAAMKLRHLLLGRKVMTNLDSIFKSRDITLSAKVHLVKAMVFFSSHVWMWELDYKESWVPKNWCFWSVVLETTLESPLDCKEIQRVHPKGNQSLVFIGRTDAESETTILWPPHPKCWLIGKDLDAGREGLRAEGEEEDRGRNGWIGSLTWWIWVWTLGVGVGQGGPACCDMTEWLNWMKQHLK